MAISVGEDLEVGDGIGDVLKGRIGDSQVEAESFPLGPVGAGLVGSRRNDSQGTFCRCSAEVTAESISGGMWNRRQGWA
eukprot:scaffold3079_cov119-Cylindrotheca_fusiformis.AAC.11